MSLGVSQTYIYAYIVFAAVYLVASFTFVASAVRVGTGLSRVRHQAKSAPDVEAIAAGAAGEPVAAEATIEVAPSNASEAIGHGQRIIDYTQLSTLLPLVYIVGSMFLGSIIVRDNAMARLINIGWILFTVVCAGASILFTVIGVRESGAIGRFADAKTSITERAADALQRIGVRLGVSAALLLLVAVFTMLNLWSVMTNLDFLSKVHFLL